MATLQLVQAIQSGLVNPSTGAVLASGKCRFYDVSTLTPQTVYSDSAGASPITQPLTLTAGGTGTVYTASGCRCIVKDATDTTTLYDIAVINGTAPAAQFVTSTSFNGGTTTTLQAVLDAVDNSFGGTDWKYKIGTSERNLSTVISEIQLTPQDYGAVGDGVTDDTAAFAALATAQASLNRPVFIPKGIYQLSSAITFTGAGVTISGAGRGDITTNPPSGGTTLRGTNGSASTLIISGAAGIVQNLCITHATSTSGTALTVAGGLANVASVRNVAVISGTHAVGFHCSAQSAHATDCLINGTAGTTGTWLLENCSFPGGASATSTFVVTSIATGGRLFISSTADMANGGNTTPTIGGVGQLVAFQRIRGTSAGSGTVNATSVPTETKILVCDFFNNSGGAFTFTLNAQYHGTGNPAPANGTRRLVAYAWEPTSGVWEEFARSASDVT